MMRIRMLDPDRQISGLGNHTVGDFWRWAYSDAMSNRNRFILAEFMVRVALDAVDQPRLEWDRFDLQYRGAGVEVKSAAYLQSWQQDQLSAIRFDIARKVPWHYSTNRWGTEPTRSADV